MRADLPTSLQDLRIGKSMIQLWFSCWVSPGVAQDVSHPRLHITQLYIVLQETFLKMTLQISCMEEGSRTTCFDVASFLKVKSQQFPKNLSLSLSLSLSLQLECCGVDNATDWQRLNPTVFRLNENAPPPSCICANEDGCISYGTFRAWEDVSIMLHTRKFCDYVLINC